MFVETLLFHGFNNNELALNDLAGDISSRYDVEISKQGVDGRFNQSSVKMAQALLTKMIDVFKQSHKIDETFSQFRRICIKDSTSFDLPDSLSDLFPGNGGGASMSGVSIQYEIDIKHQQNIDFEITSKAVNDYTNAEITKSSIVKDDLLIRDLGYCSLKMLREINLKEAFYLNRIKPDVYVFEKQGENLLKLDIAKIEQNMRVNGIKMMEKQVFLGCKEQLASRLIFILVPEDKIAERIKKQKRKSERRNSKVKQQCLSALGLNLYVTNANNTLLPLEHVMLLYKIRWQIELIFKAWKSVAKIHLLKKAKPERVLTMLYLKLLWIFINMQLIHEISAVVFKRQKKKLSVFKAFKIIRMQKEEIRRTITKYNKFTHLLQKIFGTIIKKALCENKKGCINSLHIVLQYSK
jgi:IS4 transposase